MNYQKSSKKYESKTQNTVPNAKKIPQLLPSNLYFISFRLLSTFFNCIASYVYAAINVIGSVNFILSFKLLQQIGNCIYFKGPHALL